MMHQDLNLREEERSQVTENTMSHVENSGLFLKTNMKNKDSCELQNTVLLFLQDDFEKEKEKGRLKGCVPERERGEYHVRRPL